MNDNYKDQNRNRTLSTPALMKYCEPEFLRALNRKTKYQEEVENVR